MDEEALKTSQMREIRKVELSPMFISNDTLLASQDSGETKDILQMRDLCTRLHRPEFQASSN